MDLGEKYDQLYKKYSQLIIVFKAYQETEKKVDKIVKRLDNVETKAAKNQEKMKDIETEVKEARKDIYCGREVFEEQISVKGAELKTLTNKVESENLNLQRGIHDLDEKISHLDDEYRSIQNDIQQRKYTIEETIQSVTKIQTDLTSIQKAIPASAKNEFKCRMCDNKFESIHVLRCHIQASHPKEIKCKQCGKLLPNNRQLEIHMEDHSQDKKFKCEVCDKAFHLKWRLVKHKSMHGQEGSIRKCHYFNNGKICPFEASGYKFLHKESMLCQFQSQCNHDKCQFRH